MLDVRVALDKLKYWCGMWHVCVCVCCSVCLSQSVCACVCVIMSVSVCLCETPLHLLNALLTPNGPWLSNQANGLGPLVHL